MNRFIRASVVALSLSALGAIGASAADPVALVDFGKLTPSANCEFVEVNISGPLLKFAATCASKQEPLVAEMLRGLKHVRVNVIGLDDTNRAATTERVTTIRKDLTAQGWTPIVTARGKGTEDVVIFAKMLEDETIDGLVVTVLEAKKQAVLVNIVGQIKADQIASLAEHLNIPELKLAGKAANR
ncbi:MAG TPA: DUF4252 domain-containing protein [Opitutaceae bacterium]|nr:DUF4252 domain-containing protein [Opitutaceae bacterium]